MSDLQKQEAGVAEHSEASSLLDSIIDNSRIASNEQEKDRTRDLISELVDQVLAGTVTISRDLSASMDVRIAEIDALISEQLNEIMHHADFQKLESSWRGLKYLTAESETSTMLKIKVLNASKKDLLKDFKASAEFDQSALFKKIYEEEYGTFGGAPYAGLVGDFEFGRHPEDFYLLEELSHVAAASHAPLITSAGAGLFGLESFTDIGKPRDLAKIFDTVEYTKWKAFRESDDSRYVGMVLPHVLGRLPYGRDTVPVEDFDFEENVDGTDHSKYLWTNASYAYAARLTAAFAEYGWLAAIRGVEGGGLVEGLPAHTFKTDDGEVALKCPTEVAVTDRTEKLLSDLGFISLVHCKNTDYAAFFSGQSSQKAKSYNTDSANANARLSTQLPYIFSVSRIAHYMKSIMRDKIGSFASRQNVQDFLNTWLAQYVLLDDSASQEAKAKYPLREARVDVVEVPGKPGVYRAAAFLRPHFQLDELTISLRLVAELPKPTR
ncbi:MULTISPECIES: type VI secretion system contractile sheath large subunit [Iodobacter]|jgi:type VI secretion system protein ImpC|uniref:Type VI secretion system contractile sheath large subunit n=1 Tax=Iodobacter fluviatilis TaxID=537 RepID=A0A7G3G4S5_9NEIS|nr:MULTISPECIES: type VI secretion system contractile sheath large subunit [Iodobacter]MDW5418464.1 type VI secretion system contractile sheath large subunit [Iodobacter sp. CM08]QBC42214.1 type VI secretion system contractile sheath large subunit [Iodobacter fluviatilis]